MRLVAFWALLLTAPLAFAAVDQNKADTDIVMNDFDMAMDMDTNMADMMNTPDSELNLEDGATDNWYGFGRRWRRWGWGGYGYRGLYGYGGLYGYRGLYGYGGYRGYYGRRWW